MPAPDALDPVALLAELVAIPSPSGAEGAAVAFAVSAARRLGFAARRDEVGNLVAELGEGPETHVLLGHVDTVPGEIPVRLEKGELWGRGTVDAKGPLAAFLCAAARVGAVPGHRVVVVGAVEEEAASSKGAWHVRDRYRPRNAVIGEPSGAQAVTLGYKGRLLVRAAWEERKRHSSVPAPTPAERAAAFWEAAREDARAASPEGGAFERLQASLEGIASESLPFLWRAEARVGYRLQPGCDLEALKRRLGAAAGPAASLAFEGEVAAFRAGKGTPVVRAFLGAIREAGLEPAFKVKTGTSDLNVVGPVWGPSVVAYGPGDSSLDHTPEERIEVEEYRRGIDVLERVLRRLTGKPS